MTDKLFLDTNVVVDLLGEREPFYNSATKINTLAENGELQVIDLTYSVSRELHYPFFKKIQ